MIARPVLAVCLLAASAPAYYHFLHFASRTGPFTPIPEKFDLAALPNKTLYFYVSDAGPNTLAPGDNFPAVLSQLRLAGRTWNDVETSDLRVVFGGLFTPGTVQNRPRLEVIFTDELQPGVIAQGGVTTRADITTGPGGQFVPILRSVVLFPNDISARPSYSTDFFLPAVHEMGHALGLQHTLTSSVMTVEVTRRTTKAQPLAADDIAGISLLYPSPAFAGRFGSIAGRVTAGGNGVHLASVVALPPVGPAVSALTLPDGTYRIEGLPPAPYYVYVHPLPPSVQPELGPAEIVLPLDQENKSIPAGDSFQAQFYPGTRNPDDAALLTVSAEDKLTDINFAVESRGATQLVGVQTYSFPDEIAVRPAFINTNNPARHYMLAAGTGLMSGGAPVNGLRVSVLGNSVPIGGVYPAWDSRFLKIDFTLHPFTSGGPRHLVFSTPDELYVLPAALTVVNRQPPSIDSIASETDGSGSRVLVIAGSNLTAETRILFDGVPARIRSFDESRPSLTVTPPPAPAGHRANVVALQPDGQTSMFVQFPPQTYSYDAGDAPGFSLSSYAQAAGTEAMIEVRGVNTDFTAADARLGFGSSDVTVKRVWIVSPTLIRANIVVSAGAPGGTTEASVVSGLQAMWQSGAFQIQSSNGRLSVSSDLQNPATGEPWVFPGSNAALTVNNLPAGSNPSISLNDASVTVVSTDRNLVVFQVPASLAPGPAILRLNAGLDSAPAVIVMIEPAPPVISSIQLSNVALAAENPARPGDIVTITVSGLGDPGAPIPAARIRLKIAGIEHRPLDEARPGSQPGTHQLQILLSPQVPGGTQLLTVSIDNRTSAPFPIAIRTSSAT